MKIILRSFASLMLLGLWASSPVRADDTDRDSRPGFFHRLGDAIFRGTRKLEKSDTVDASGSPISDDTVPRRASGAKPKKVTATPPKEPAPVPASSHEAESSKVKDARPAPVDDKKEAPAQPASSKDYPFATRASKPGFVKSPFPPYHELDATGMISGSLARDPTNGKVFRVP
jgi:hypothetical protein